MAGQKNMKHRKLARKQLAEERIKERSLRTDKQQLDHLDKILGKGIGAKKERKRLKAKIANKKSTTNKKES